MGQVGIAGWCVKATYPPVSQLSTAEWAALRPGFLSGGLYPHFMPVISRPRPARQIIST